MYGMAQSWKRMMTLGALGVGSVGIAGAGAALMTPTGHALVRGERTTSDTGVDDVSVEEWLATPIQSWSNRQNGNPARAMTSLKAYLRPELRQEFEFNGNTYWFLLVDSDNAPTSSAMPTLAEFRMDLNRLARPATNHAYGDVGMPPVATDK